MKRLIKKLNVHNADINFPTIRLVITGGHHEENSKQFMRKNRVELSYGERQKKPSVLGSYAYFKGFYKTLQKIDVRNWVFDSGAFTAFNTGKKVDLDKYIELCLQLKNDDKNLGDIFTLDVVPTNKQNVEKCWRQGIKNTEKMWNVGIEAIPVYHLGEPEEVLLELSRSFSKIAIGGFAQLQGKLKIQFAEQCFARVWPKKIHGLGVGDSLILQFPFHTTDASSWRFTPCAYGGWKRYGRMSVYKYDSRLESQIDYYLKLEQKARVKWKREMQELEELDK